MNEIEHIPSESDLRKFYEARMRPVWFSCTHTDMALNVHRLGKQLVVHMSKMYESNESD